MDSPLELPCRELIEGLSSGRFSSRELTAAALDDIQKHDPAIGAFLSVQADTALAQADAIDSRRQAGEALGLLAGLPIAIKECICTRGLPATCASRMLANYVSPYDAHVIERLRQHDAVLIGRTNMDEFAMGSSSENSAFQLTRNPWDLSRTPGGSSSGSAAAVAARFVPVSLGSDTGGSIRQPAGLCGIVGLKPTYGRVSRYGLVAFASSLDQIGPFSNDVYGAALTLTAIAGRDERDSTSAPRAEENYLDGLDQPLAGLRIGYVPTHLGDGVDPETVAAIRSALDVYRQQGATLVEIDLPHNQYSIATYYLIAPAEASSNLARYDGVHYGHRTTQASSLNDMYARSRGEGFGAEVKRRIMIGAYALSAGYSDQYYVRALKVRRLIRQDYDRAFEQVDVIAGPVTPAPAFRLGELTDDPLAMYLSDIFTIGANLAGLPAISIPAGVTKSGLPIGLHLLAPAFEEHRLLRAAYQFEQATEHHRQVPARPFAAPAHAEDTRRATAVEG